MHIQNEENMQTTTTICLYTHEETNNNISTLMSQVSKRFPLISPSRTVYAWEIFCFKNWEIESKDRAEPESKIEMRSVWF